MHFWISLLILLGSLGAHSVERCEWLFQSRLKFGPEFTFTNDAVNTEGNQSPMNFRFEGAPLKFKAWQALATKIKLECVKTMNCSWKMGEDKHGPALYVYFKDGYWFSVGGDVGVIEVNAHPGGVYHSEQVKSRMDHFVFGLAKQVGLTPHQVAGGGHIHASREAFGEDYLLFRNLFTDFQSRPEISYGIFGRSLNNGPPLAALNRSRRDAYEAVLTEFDGAPLRSNKKMDEFIKAIESRVYTSSYNERFGSPDYYQALNMTRMFKPKGKATFEFRAFDPQTDYNTYQLQIRFIEAWIMRLREVREPIPYIRREGTKYTNQQIIDAFYDLVKFIGLDFEEFRPMVPRRIRHLTPSQLNQTETDFL